LIDCAPDVAVATVRSGSTLTVGRVVVPRARFAID
jgi:hypothetical protein